MAEPILEVKDLDVRFATPDGEVHAVRNASFDVRVAECLGVVGESGSGKSQLFLATQSVCFPRTARRPAASNIAARKFSAHRNEHSTSCAAPRSP